ncbi:MAG: RAMP superfamily CRISPR-associated protein [Prochlorotrichaceae cyanobacterium]|jgi:CRISPR-associated protein Cmr4
MYNKAYGIIETLAPVHVGATAGEETGNLNLIFRDQFTQTGMIPGSSIRGRFRSNMRETRIEWLEEQWQQQFDSEESNPQQAYSLERDHSSNPQKFPSYLTWLEKEVKCASSCSDSFNEQHWYGHEAVAGQKDGGTSEALVKFEYASLLWLPVFCPGQPVVWVSCPYLLKRYKRITGLKADLPLAYSAQKDLPGRPMKDDGKILFFNLGFLEIEHKTDLSPWIPEGVDLDASKLVVVGDNDMAMIHDMALYRQSRVKLLDDMKKVDTEKGAFFNTEALPEGSVLVFPIAVKQTGWKPFGEDPSAELYFGGLESIGFGRCNVTLQGAYQ